MAENLRSAQRGRTGTCGLIRCSPLAFILLAGCTGPQSALDPAGPIAGAINGLGWAMTIGAAIILVVVVAVAWLAIRRRAQPQPMLGSNRLVVAGGIVLPVVVLPVLLIAGLLVARGSGATGGEPYTIRVTGEQFWWRVDYLASDGRTILATANELHIPVGSRVRLVLESADVIHSFWVPALGGKLDMIPGRSNEMAVEADRAGVFRGQCAEFCGDQHARMAFMVIAEEPATFDAWLAAQQAPAAADPPLQSGSRRLPRRWLRRLSHRARDERHRNHRSRPHPCRQPPDHRRRHLAQRHRFAGRVDCGRAGAEAGQPHAVLHRASGSRSSRPSPSISEPSDDRLRSPQSGAEAGG